MPKNVAVILLNWNTKIYTEQCIISLKAYASESLFDIIIADNGSTDGSLLYLKSKFPDLIYLDNKTNLGFAEGNNRALNLSIKLGFKYSLLLNTDTIIKENVVQKLFDYLETYDNIAAVQPAIYYLNDKNKLWNGEMDFNPILGYTFSKAELPNIPKAVKWITGCCFLIRNTVLEDVGMFNKRFFLYYEDVELSYRLRSKGYQLNILPNITVFHEAGVSGKLKSKSKEGYLSPIIHYYLTRNKIWFLRRYGNKWFFPFILLNLIVQSSALLCYFVINGKTQKLNNLLKGIKDGLLTPSKNIWIE